MVSIKFCVFFQSVRFFELSSLDDIIWEPTPNVAARTSGCEQKPEISKRSGLSAANIRRSSLSRSATAPPTSITSIAKASSTSVTDSDKHAASAITRRPGCHMSADTVNVVNETLSDVGPSVAARIGPPETNMNIHSVSVSL